MTVQKSERLEAATPPAEQNTRVTLRCSHDSTDAKNFNEQDLRIFGRLGISAERLAEEGVRRISHEEAEKYGFNVSYGNCSGLLFPYIDWRTDRPVTYRLRREHPDIENGKPEHKYLLAASNRRKLYVPRSCHSLIPDKTVRAVICESEKASLMFASWSQRLGIKLLPIATGGCYGWRGRIGKVEDAAGHRVDERGALPDLRALCAGREVIIMFDANASCNPAVQKARRELARELTAMGSRVLIANVTDVATDTGVSTINGPDDLYAVLSRNNHCDEIIQSLLDNAPPAVHIARAEAEAVITRLATDKENIDLLREAVDAIKVIPDKLTREMLRGRLKRLGLVPVKVLDEQIGADTAEQQARTELITREVEEAVLRDVELDLVQMISDLENFFEARAHLPAGGALVLAVFTLNTWTFDYADTTPYLCIESATKRCGKTKVAELLAALCCRAEMSANCSDAIYRLIDATKPTLIVDEAEALKGNSPESRKLRAIFHTGDKRSGSKVCFDKDQNGKITPVRYKTFCPKIFIAIGGLDGPLLDRSIVLHLERRPLARELEHSIEFLLKTDAAPLVEQMRAYAVQYRGELERIYRAQPRGGYWPWAIDREGQIWGPLMIHARVIGGEIEARLATVARNFIAAKGKIEAEDASIAKALAVLQALEAGPEFEWFTPGDLFDELAKSEAWGGVYSRAKGDKRVVCAKIGYLLGTFRLQSERKEKGKSYRRQEAISAIRSHVPSEPFNHSAGSSQVAEKTATYGRLNGLEGAGNHSAMQPVENKQVTGVAEWMNGLNSQTEQQARNHLQGRLKLMERGRITCPKCGGDFAPQYLPDHLLVCKQFAKAADA